MKVFIVNTYYYPFVSGGAGYSVQYLAEALVTLGIEVVVVSTTDQEHERVTYVNGVKVYYLLVGLIGKSFLNTDRSLVSRVAWAISTEINPIPALRLGRVLDKERPTVVHTNQVIGFSPAIFSVIHAKGYPLVHTLRDYYLICHWQSMYKKGKNCRTQCTSCRLSTLRRRLNSNLVDAVVGNSKFILDRHLSMGYFRNTTKRHVIFGSIKPGSADKPAEQRGSEKVLRLGFIGRFHPTKGIERVLDVLPDLPPTGWHLVLAGRGAKKYEQNLVEQFSHENIEHLGWIEPSKFFNRIDLLVVPALWEEPLARVIYEAYAHGVPVLASSRGGSPEIVDEGKTGWLFNPDDRQALKAKLSLLVAHPERARGLSGNCHRKSAEFLPARSAERYQMVYKSVLETESRGQNQGRPVALSEAT